ncbi:MAG TPA: IS5 family transposase, partial [Gemmataceae bacterium]|nr:IS5 family transposase [Gemmataceae bacterium]
MPTQRYPSDLTDEQWALVEPLIPVYPGGRPRQNSMREVLNAIFYVLRTGCQWRFLPKDLPPKSTVWGYYDEWRHNGTLDRVHDALRDRVRRQEKPGRPRRTASIDSQSVDSSSGGEAVGRDNAKKVDGRKRHIVVDSLGLLLAVTVTAANVDDAAAAPAALAQL